MKATLAILTIGVVPVSEVLPLLTEHVSEQQITHLSLLGKLSREEVMEDYAVGEGDSGESMKFWVSHSRDSPVSTTPVFSGTRS